MNGTAVAVPVFSAVEKWIMIPIYLACMAGGSAAQALILLVVIRSRRIQSTTNYFIIALACQGLTFLVLVLASLAALEFDLPKPAADRLCRAGMATLLSCVACNQTVLAATGLDRYNAVVSPLDRRFNFLNIKLLIAVSVGLGVAVSVPTGFYTTAEAAGSKSVCSSVVEPPYPVLQRVHLALYIVLFYGMCFLAILVCYVKAVLLVWRVSHNSAAIRSLMIRRTLNYLPKARIQVLKILLVITLMDVVIMSGLFVVLLIVVLAHWYNHFLCVSVLYFVSTVQKPLFYFRMHRSFRQGCRETVCCCRRPRRANTYRITKMPFWGKTNDINVNVGPVEHKPTSSSQMLIFTVDKPSDDR